MPAVDQDEYQEPGQGGVAGRLIVVLERSKQQEEFASFSPEHQKRVLEQSQEYWEILDLPH